MSIEGRAPNFIYTVEEAVIEIYKATSSVYWPQYFDQWTMVLIEAGFEQAEVYAAVDNAKGNVKERAKNHQKVEKSDIIIFASLITRYHQNYKSLSSKNIH